MHWVERASFERIQRLLEISEQEQHHEVLLTDKNLQDLSLHPSPNSVPIIPRPLPSEIVEGEHFITRDLLNLIPGSSSPAREVESEVFNRELVVRIQPEQPSSASKDFGPTPRASRQVEGGNHSERPPLARKGSRPASQASKKKKGTFRRLKIVGAGAEDFIMWVPLVSQRSPDWEEEEEKDGMSDLIHNFVARKRKRDASLEQAVNAIHKVAGGSSQPHSDENSEVQAIVISGSPEMGLTDQPALENVTLAESREVSSAPIAI